MYDNKKESKLPKEIQILTDDLIWAIYDLRQYRLLFANNPLQKMLMEKAAKHYFTRLHQIYWDRFTLSISRLTDPLETGSNDNLSIYVSRKYYDLIGDSRISIEERLLSIQEEAKAFRMRRSKYIAHRDYNKALDDKVEDDPLVLTKVISIYKSIGEIINVFHIKMDDTQMSWNLDDNSDAHSILFYLKEGSIYSELKEKRKDYFLDNEEMKRSQWKDLKINNIDEYNIY